MGKLYKLECHIVPESIVLARDPPSRHLGRVIGHLDGQIGGQY